MARGGRCLSFQKHENDYERQQQHAGELPEGGVEGAIGRSKSNSWSGQISSDMAKSDVTLNEYFGGISQEAHYKLLPPKTTDYTTYTLLLAPAGWLAVRLDGIPSRSRGRYWRNRLHICLVTRSYQTKFCLSGR